MSIQTERNKKNIRRIYSEIFNVSNEVYELPLEEFTSAILNKSLLSTEFDLIDELYDRNVVSHDPAVPQDLCGTDQLKILLKSFRNAFPDHIYSMHEVVAEGDMVTCRWTVKGTHEGELMGIKATGKKAVVEGISICRFNDQGKIAEIWQLWDRQGMLEQLGVVAKIDKVGAA